MEPPRKPGRFIVNMGWSYVDWKTLRGGRHGFLHGPADNHKFGRTRARYLWTIEDIAEFEALCHDAHPDYPRARNMPANKTIREAYEYLSDPENRTIEIDSVVKFEKSIYGDLSFHKNDAI